MNLRAFQSRELGIRRDRTGVFEIQNSCMTRRVELFPLPEDLTPQPRRLRHGAGGRRAGDHVEELFTIKSEGQGRQEALSAKRKEQKAVTHSVPGSGLGSGYPSL